MKVLYVEDNPANVFLVKRVARMGNHEIVNYIDGDKAIQKFDEINPDLVLMDIQLAGNKSGLDVVKDLRAKGVKTPIIAVTAYAMVGDKERCIEAGCNDYLPKPLPIQRLVEIFKEHAERVNQASVENKADDEVKATTAKAEEKAVEDTPPVAEDKTDTLTETETQDAPVVKASTEDATKLETATETEANSETDTKAEEASSQATDTETEANSETDTKAEEASSPATGAESIEAKDTVTTPDDTMDKKAEELPAGE